MAAKKKSRTPYRPDSLVTTIPVMRPCARCASWLAAGIAEGIHAEVDLTALDPGQTILAMLLELPLYCLTRSGLVHLDPWRLTDPRFASRLPRHKCGVVWESRLPGAGPIISRATSETPSY